MRGIQRSGHGAKERMRTRGQLMRENKTLRDEVLNMSRENARLREEHAENARLRSMLDFRTAWPTKLLMAQVIAKGASQWHDTCSIDRGWRNGVAKSDPVVTPRGVVGQVIDVGPDVSQVLLLTDQSCGVGAIVQRSRVTGICQGQQTGSLSMDYVDKEADIKVGDLIVTSGIGRIYPKGLQLGRVTKIHNTSGYMKSADVRPSVEFDKLEEAAVVIRKSEQ
jgi:rod shape-determining protein MreC